MTTIKRGRPPKQIEPEQPQDIKPAEQIDNTHIEIQKPAEPVIRILPPDRALPKLQPIQTRIAVGNVKLCHKKTGKCISVARGYAERLLLTNKDYEIR